MYARFTHTISNHDVWNQDHEESPQFVTRLGKLWKAVLAKDDATLGIDPEISRPGLICFLENFKTMAEAIDTYGEPELKFKFIV